jgi:hypothetical protein
MKLTHDLDWETHHQGMETLKDIEQIVQKAFEHVRTITKKTTLKILSGIHTSREEPELHVLVEIDGGWCRDEAYVYVVPEGIAFSWDRRPPVLAKTAHVPQAMTRAVG